jgi:hypothetical protein
MKHTKRDSLQGMRFLVQRINEINDWRNKAVKHAINRGQVKRIDDRALHLRNAAEKTSST